MCFKNNCSTKFNKAENNIRNKSYLIQLKENEMKKKRKIERVSWYYITCNFNKLGATGSSRIVLYVCI